MSDRESIEPIVERVVGQVLESHVAQLRSEITRRVTEEIAAQPGLSAAQSPTAQSANVAADLARAVSEIQMGTSQKEVLRALLDSSSRYAARVALFIVKGRHATGWQARGFANSDAIKDFALDSSAPAVVRAIDGRAGTNAAGVEFDSRFLEDFGNPTAEARLWPLILKDRVAALFYADGGSEPAPFDTGSLEVLVLSTSAWLEVNALRKGQKSAGAPSEEHAPAHQEAAPAPPFNDPFAAHAPAYAMAAAASGNAGGSTASASPWGPSGSGAHAHIGVDAHSAAADVATMASATAEAVAEALPIGYAQAEAPAETAREAAVPAPAVSPQDQETHRKAQRFARLLVDEIKLYNQAKVSEGRKHKDLFDRLRDTIEKSQITYQKRYGNTVAASGKYFQHELIHSLAEDDASCMGPNFHL